MVCCKAIVKRECLVFYIAVWIVTSKHRCWGECNSDCMLFPVCLSDLVTSRPRSARYYLAMDDHDRGVLGREIVRKITTSEPGKNFFLPFVLVIYIQSASVK